MAKKMANARNSNPTGISNNEQRQLRNGTGTIDTKNIITDNIINMRNITKDRIIDCNE